MVLNIIINWVLSALAFGITAYLVPGFRIDSWQAAAIAVIVMALVNAIIKPILTLFTLPLTLLTLGLFLFVVNAISIALVAYLTPGFSLTGFWAALLGSIVLSFVSGLLDTVSKNFGI